MSAAWGPLGRLDELDGPSAPEGVALAHDYLTQRGGAERLLKVFRAAFPDAPLYTSLHEPEATFAELAHADIRPGPTNRFRVLRADHRRALPVLAIEWGRKTIDAPVVVASSTGWAHGARATGRKVGYINNTARWLYQPDDYLRGAPVPMRAGIGVLSPVLKRWDRRAAASCHRLLANSAVIRERIRVNWGLESEVLHPASSFDPTGPIDPIPGVEPGFVLVVARLLPYKHIDAAIAAVESMSGARLLVVGDGPERDRLRDLAGPRTTFVTRASENQLRWAYRSASMLLALAHEDFGLSPIESMACGTPVVALRTGGFLETVAEGVTGVFVDDLRTSTVVVGIKQAEAMDWDCSVLVKHTEQWDGRDFVRRLREIALEELERV